VPVSRWILALAAALLPTCLPAAASAGPIRTLLLGDSITAGIVSGDGGPSWAELLAADLAASHDVVNIAVSGTSSVYWAPSTPCPGICGDVGTLFEAQAVPELPADVATLLLGTNDATAFFLPDRTPLDDYEDFMREILDGLFGGGVASVVLMTAPAANVSEVAVELLAGYRERVGQICQDTAFVVCGPDLYALLDPATDFAPGDVHPNAVGHAKIAGAVAASLRSIPEPGTGALLAVAVALALAIGCPGTPRHQ